MNAMQKYPYFSRIRTPPPQINPGYGSGASQVQLLPRPPRFWSNLSPTPTFDDLPTPLKWPGILCTWSHGIALNGLELCVLWGVRTLIDAYMYAYMMIHTCIYITYIRIHTHTVHFLIWYTRGSRGGGMRSIEKCLIVSEPTYTSSVFDQD